MKQSLVFNRKMTMGEIQLRIKRGQIILCPICGGAMELWDRPNLSLPSFPMGLFCSADAEHSPVITGYASTTLDD